MSKGARIAEKKKAFNKKSKKPMGKLEIEFFEDGSIEVNGPITNQSLFMRIMAGAIGAVAEYHERQKLVTAVVPKEKSKLISIN